ncbi:hypothetical protein [Uliginosibacterium sp. TH139]|uniref:hypothetical protein n=1 Tax=Uliginosibacterium sp. TH139 TaxID=2067453 RepID=UPI0011802256|nr:hypothetical protein [Uliginosibacterium sp. TH139]
MKNNLFIGLLVIFLGVFGYFALRTHENDLATEGSQLSFSTNIDELRRYINIDSGLQVSQWEIFGTPDWEGGVPGPTDYLSILFVGPTEHAQQKSAGDESHKVDFLPPNAVRAWLGSEEKEALQRILGRKSQVANAFCALRSFYAVKSNKSVEGFACILGTRTLYFVLLAEPAP